MLEATAFGKAEHRLVIRHDLADQFARAAIAPIGDQLVEQRGTLAMAFEVGAHGNGKFRLLVVGIGNRPHNTQRFRFALIIHSGGDEGYLAIIVDLRVPGHLRMRQIAKG